MDKDLIEGKEHDVDLEIKDGKIALVGKYNGKGGGADLTVFVSIDYFFDKLADKIPGKIDDAVLAVAKEALKAI